MRIRVKDFVPGNIVLEAITRFDEFLEKAKVTKGLMLEYTETAENRAIYFMTDEEYNISIMFRVKEKNHYNEEVTRDYFIDFELDDSEKLDIFAKIVKESFDLDLGKKARA